MNRRLVLALAVAGAGLLAVGVALAVALRGDETEPAPELRALEVEHCRDFADDDARGCYSREFLAMVDGTDEDPRPAVARITDAARSEGGFLLANCHVVMHTVGRTYARDSGVTLATLMDYLPADNDPGWFAVAGADDAKLSGEAVTDPYRLCAVQPRAYVRSCWYRAFLENRPAGFRVRQPSDIVDLCDGQSGLQREGCVTAASLIGPPDPAVQLRICARMRSAADAASCVRGTKVQNLQDAPTDAYVQLVEGCEPFAPAARGACYRWLGKAMAVLTDGEFESAGCPRPSDPAARRQCEAGARTMEDALVTFS